MWNDDDRKWLYEQMKAAGVNTGTYDDFTKSLNNKEDRDWYYNKSRSLGLNVGSADDFAGMMVEPVAVQPQRTQQPSTQPVAQPVVKPASQPQQQPKPRHEAQQPLTQSLGLPSWDEMLAEQQNKFELPPMFESEVSIDADGNRVSTPKLVPGFDAEGHMAPGGVYRDALTGKTYDPQDPNVQQQVQKATRTTPIDLKQANRQQVASLSQSIDDALLQARGESVRMYTDAHQKAAKQGLGASLMLAASETAGAADPTDMQFMQRRRLLNAEYTGTEEGEQLARRISDLETAQRSMRDARRIISEADHNAKEGTFGKWLESSFAGGAARGFGQKLFDIDTWDMGVSDMQDAGNLLLALRAFDSGKPLTESQQAMLDAKAVELATNAYFGSYVGRGYKAGEVTAESIPFMIEMFLNPAAGTGQAAENMLARYALKRFGKQAVKQNAKKYVAAKVATRVVGDVVGSAAMAATTGAIGVGADTMDRMNGQVQTNTDADGQTVFAGHDEGEDFGTAFGKAFAARTIENYSEMVGEYFAPVLGVGGQYVRKGMGKIGLESVSKFMDDVAMSDVGRLVTDFEKHAKWNGVFGEYAEEVAGGIMNALVVGDQTLDTNPDTGVFNLDNNIDTFLGVSLMGGFMSAMKTAGYRTPKYRARQDMKAKDDAAAAVFANQDTWGEIRNTLAFGEDKDVKAKLAEVMTNGDFTPEQKAAALEYAQAVEAYRGMLRGENKRREEGAADATQTDAETSFDNGYSLESDQEMNDAKNMLDFQRQRIGDFVTDDMLANFDSDPVGALNGILASDAWTDEEKQAATDYVNAKATYDGMIQHVQDDMQSRVTAAISMVNARVHPDGQIHPATMKVDDRKVYVIGGNLVMNEDGTMIDHEKSDESVIVRDAETGNVEFADPRDVLSVDEPLDAAKEKQMAQEAIRQEYAQQAANKIDGVLPFNEGDQYTVMDEQGGQHTASILPTPIDEQTGQPAIGEGEVLVSVDGGEAVVMPKEQVQSMAENANLARLQQYEQEQTERRAAQAEAEREASRPTYSLNDEVTLQTDEGQVRGSITAEANEDGLIEVYTERPIGGKKINLYNRDELDAMLIEHNGAQQQVETPAGEIAGTTAQQADGETQLPPLTNEGIDAMLGAAPAAGTVAGLGENAQEVHGGESGQQPAGETAGAAAQPMPMIGEGEDAEPDFSKVEPARAHAFIYNEAGLSRDEANQFVEANKKAADKALTTIQGKKPKMGTSLAKYRKDTAEWEQKVAQAQQQADYWKQVKDEQGRIVAAERAAQAERDAQLHEQAVADEQERQAAVIQQREEQAALGTHNAAPAIREKWEAAPKVEGARNELVLANGEKVPGRYVLVESGAATPSHNPAAGFTKNEGFPMDENEQSVNDRDYERDQDAQTITRQIADQYDSRAMQTPVVVSSDGVVLSGNGRTMAGELAAQNGTDGAYVEHLKKYGQQFGFTPEQMEGMEHPRVVFVPDEAMPYTADTFAKFNQQEMKGQSKTEQAVKFGKVVGDETFGRIIRSINAYDTLGEYYADPSATTQAINELRDAGAISQAQYAEMFDGETISAQGREVLENTLIGKAFESNPDAVRQITAFKGVRQSVITALAEISNNLMLGEDYSHENELAQAINLVYQARQSGYKQGDKVSGFARQQNLFAFDDGATVADYNNATVLMYADLLNEGRPTLLKKALALYNQAAKESANGQLDIFSGGVKTQEEILNDVKQLLRNGTEEEQQTALAAATAERKAAAAEGGNALVSATPTDEGTGIQANGTTGSVDQGSEATREPLTAQQESEEEAGLRSRIETLEDDETTEDSPEGVVYHRPILIDGTHRVEQIDAPDKKGNYNGSYFVYEGQRFGGLPEVVAHIDGKESPVTIAEREVNTEPTPAQRDAGNYKKGHVKIDGYDISIENPKGSVRRGTAHDGTEWETRMNNTYGYIRGTEGVDGDHIDVFLSDNPESGNVYVIDQRNADGSFDEHKVMYGFNSADEARAAYLSNYEEGWQGLGAITEVSKDEFKKWVNSSHRKTKPFAEYKSVKPLGGQNEGVAMPSQQTEEANTVGAEVAAEWLLSSGQNAINSTDYLLKALSGVFSKATQAIEAIRQKYAPQFAASEYSEIKNFVGSDLYQQVVGEIKNVLDGTYNNAEASNILDTIMQSPTGLPMRTGQEVSRRLEALEQVGNTQLGESAAVVQQPTEQQPQVSLTEGEAETIIGAMKDRASFAPFVEITDENWRDSVTTPIGEVRMGANQKEKLFAKGREQQYGMVLETLEHPDLVLEETDKEENMFHERPSSYLFVKTFQKPDGSKYVHFESVTVQQDGMEVSVSSHIIRENQLRNKVKSDRLLYKATALDEPAHSSAEQPTNEGSSLSSEGKGSDFSASEQGNAEKSAIEPEFEAKYQISPKPYTTKKGKVLDMQLVKFADELKDKVIWTNARQLAKDLKGWWSREDGGFLMRDAETAQQLADTVLSQIGNNDAMEQQLRDERLSLSDMALATDEAQNVEAVDAQQEAEALTQQPPQEAQGSMADNGYGANNILVSRDRYEELKERMRKKMLGQLNMGIDPEILAIGTEMAAFHIEAGARKFADFAKKMIEDLGDAIRPYLKSFYNGARDLPEVEKAGYTEEMSPYDEVKKFDVANFDKASTDSMAAAEQVMAEQEAARQADEAKEIIREIAEKGSKSEQKRGKATPSKKKSVTLQQEPDLFGSFGEDATHVESLNDNSNGHARTDAVRSEGLPADGNQQGEHTERRSQASGQEGERAERGREVRGNGSLQQGLHDGLRPSDQLNNTPTEKRRTRQPLERPNNPKNTHNNHAERGKDYAPRGVDARIDANIKAIELMQQLVESGEQATPEQMDVLRQFSGWGGLGKAFSSDGLNGANGRLRQLLGEEAYEQANMSRNSAYYTPANVIDALWDVARAMGFKGGRVLEGSAGIGNILGLMPTDMSERSDIHAVEIDQTTGNILSLLYPDAKVDVQGFEATQVENGSVDLAITNVPFVPGMLVPKDTSGDSDLSRKFRNSIQDFCIAKNVRKLREGGIGIFITSRSTLDDSARLREWVIQEGGADVVGAFRLNNETFGGTGATSDIIVIRKRVNGKKSPHAIDVLSTTGERTAEYDTGETKKVKGEEIPIIKQLSMDYNSYFARHPEMMGGEMHFNFEMGETRYPTSRSLFPVKGKNQADMLKSWSQSFDGKDWGEVATVSQLTEQAIYEELGEGVKEGSMVVSNGQLCIAQRGKAVPLAVNANKVKGHSKVECFEAYQGIKKALSDLLQYQTDVEDDSGLQPLLKALNKAYDDFVKTYGHLHKNTSISFLKNDVDFANILALEKFSERGDVKTVKRIQEFGKTDIFSQRVVEKEKAPEPTNVQDGIIASIYVHGRVDIPWMAATLSQHTGHAMTEEQIKAEIVKSGLGFENPVTRQMEVSYEYLSGNVREKLVQAQANNADGQYDANIKALEAVVPMDIPAHLIDFSIGSSWIDPKLYEEYVKEKTDIDVTFTSAGGTWFMRTPYSVSEQKNRAMGVVSELLHKTIMGTQLIEAAMQNKTITVSETHKKWDGSTETITDKEATQACSNKIDEIRQDFKEWARAKMQSDPAMSERIERIYNDMFNNYVPKSIPMRFVPEYFGGATHSIKLRPHQAQAVIRGTTQPLLLAHEVGSGKTYTLISTAMEMRRLGTARKPMIVVQNATVGQFVEDAKELYPGAKVLTIEEADRTAEGRKNFYAKIKYNDWDMIVVPQSVFERIPDSEERQMKFVQDKIEEKMLVLEQMRDADPDSSSWIVKQAEKEINKLEDELAGLTDSISSKRKERDEKKEAVTRQNAEVKALEMLDRQTDDVENFDDMGIDAILVDEAHEYKHLGFATAMQRGVKGVDPSYSKKAQGVYLKTQAVLEKNNGRNVVFATGTPISNTAAEIWTFMRYLMPADMMKEYGIYYFDDFVRNFGNLQQMLEFTTSGKFKENNRFAGYVNLPELVRIWAGVADTVLNEDVEKQRIAEGGESKIPEMEDGKATDIYLPQTRALRSVMKYVKKQLDDFDKMSGKDKKANSHIPLTMYGIAKAAAVDARLVVSDAADEPQSKTNEAVRQTLRSLEETQSYHGTIALFADNYQNKRSGFNLYEDIREKLIAQGVPAEQIVVMKSGMSVKKKLEIFDKVNRGEIRVIMGSTFTLGTGVNIQERLHTLIHLDAPNRPMDYTQRNGRILRQGNLHKEMGKPVRVLRFGVEDSLDVTAYQRLKTKGAIADSIMNGKQMMSNSMENRALEEEEDVFGDTVAQLSGSEYAMLKNQAEKDVRKYEAKKKQYQADQTYCHNEIPRLEGEIRAWKERLDKYRKNLAIVEAVPQHTEPSITVGKQTFPSIEAMADFIKEYNKSIKEAENDLRDNPSLHSQTRRLTVNVGGIDFVFTTEQNVETKEDQGTLFSAVRRKMTYSCEALGLTDVPVHQSLLREGLEDIVNNVISGQDFREGIERSERIIEKNEKSLAQVRERHGKPFEFEKELEQAYERFDEYSELMKKELEEKEKKYAEMDADVEEASDISEAEESEDESKEKDSDVHFRDGEDDIEDVNGRFNERLEELDKDRNQKDRILHLGYPGTFLLNGGIADGEIVMDFDKFVRKSSENYKHPHPFTADDIKDLPKAINAPIAVFESSSHEGDNVILTELKKNGRNFIVVIRAKKQNRKGGIVLEVNDIQTLYPKDAKGIIKWFLDGLHTQVDKEKALRWIEALRSHPGTSISEELYSESSPLTGQQRTILADVDINELNSAAKIVENFENPKLSEENLREREGEATKRLTYEESLAMSRRAGYTKKQHDAWQERAWRHMHEAAESTVERLGLGGRVTIMENADGLKGRKAKAKGWFDAKTGKIVVVLGNHHSVSDVVKTILHEGVAHYGLRKLFGQHFDQFLDNVYQYGDESVRREIVELAKKHGWDFSVATEEYLAWLAEDTDFERATNQGWWSKIKSLFFDMLYHIGLGDYGGAILTNNELRYILWRSYENMAEPGRYRNPFREAEDITMQMKLGVGSFDRERARIHSLGRIDNSRAVAAEAATMSQRTGQGVLFRDGDFSERDRATARNTYEEMVSSGLYQFQEAVQDSMLGLKKLYDAILSPKGKVHMEDVEGYENAYLAENRMSSVNAAEQHDYYLRFMQPLLKAIGSIAGNKKGARQALTDYMMAKHGLERNRVFAERDAREVEANGGDFNDAYQKFREKDYSGLTALTGEDDVVAAEAAAQQIVDDYEAAYDTADLWDRTREATQATLEKIYRSGLLSKERYEQIRDMFEYYIPLQGWDETTSDEVYGYLTSKSGPFGGSPIKHAVGRSSKADDPIATIAMMADAAIRQGNRNLMKQRFLNFVLNHPSDLVSVHDLWLEYDAATDEWIPVFADLEDGDSAADVERKVEAFEQRMEQLAEAEPDRYKRGRDAQSIPYKVVKGNLKEHQVLVKRGGRTYVLTINGNPRAAQALNGLTNPDVEQGGVVGNMLKAGEWVNRHLSAFYTTRNPDFVVSNFFRDMLYSNCMTWVKESPRYALRYHKNFGMVANPVMMRRLLGKWEHGTLDRNKRLEGMFYQFMMNGGETGYTSVRDIEEHKREIAKELKKQGSMSRKAWSALGMQLDLLNRSVENCARFAAFVTSREMGRSIDRSIYDAKEVSVNFNKKGNGGKMVNATGQTLLGKVGSYVGGGGRLAYVFWNAGVQGLTNFGRAGKRHGGKAFAGAATMFILGYVIPQLAAAMGGGDGDDDDKNAYYNLPEYVRRSNICFRVGDQWVTIPLPIEFRGIYGLGELASGAISGNEHYDGKEMSYQIVSQVSQILPLDMLEGGGGVSPWVPSSAKPFVEAYVMNKGWTGLPIYKDTPWNQNDPEWTKAYKNADQTLVGASRWLNEATGGDEFKKGAIDINPAKLEYLLNGIFGGYTNTVGKLKKMGETAFGDREFDWRNMLLANRVVKTGDERTANRKLQNEYFKYKKEYEETSRLLRKYRGAAGKGVIGMAERANFIYNSPEYARYALFDYYKDIIDDYREVLEATSDDADRKVIENQMYVVMRGLIDQLHEKE